MTSERRFMAIHEAGHAIVAMALGKDLLECRIDTKPGEIDVLPDGGGYCQTFAPRGKYRSWHASSSLAGVLACAIHCRDFKDYDEWNTWENCHEDLRLFNAGRGGMTYRQGRKIALEILREDEDKLLRMAAIIEKDGFIDFSNAPDEWKSDWE